MTATDGQILQDLQALQSLQGGQTRAERIIAWVREHAGEINEAEKVQLTFHAGGATIRVELNKHFAPLAPP